MRHVLPEGESQWLAEADVAHETISTGLSLPGSIHEIHRSPTDQNRHQRFRLACLVVVGIDLPIR
jgi:hypothetical protein